MPVSPDSFRLADDDGLPAIAVDAVLDAHQDILARIKLGFGTDRATFEREVMTLVRRYAATVHLLPASREREFRQPGGLLRLGLETAFFSLQGTDAHIFSGRATIAVRRHLEPRWRLATFLAGLCAELHRALDGIDVVDAAGESWPAFLEPLHDWLARRATSLYHVRYRASPGAGRNLGLFVLPHVATTEVLQLLAERNDVIVPHLLASIGGLPVHREHNVLDALVRRSLALVIARDLASHGNAPGELRHGTHVVRFVLDAMRHLAAGDPAWRPNTDKSRLWHGADGLFLAWPGAGVDVLRLIEAERWPGMPTRPETLRTLLIEAGVLSAAPDGAATWSIVPPNHTRPLDAVRLTTPGVLFAADDARAAPWDKPLAKPATPAAATTLTGAASATTSTPASPDAVQRPLFREGDSGNVAAPAPATTPTPSTVPDAETHPAPTGPTLRAPLRLERTVRKALASIVAQLPPETTVEGEPPGVFVPLTAFQPYGIAPAQAIRALMDARMLANAAGPPTCTGPWDGAPTTGIRLAPHYIDGLASATPTPPAATPD